MFGAWHVALLVFMDMSSKMCVVSQGYLLIIATNAVIKQITGQEKNPRILIKPRHELIQRLEKVLALIMLATNVVSAVGSYYLFITMDDFLESKYEKTYKLWRDNERGISTVG